MLPALVLSTVLVIAGADRYHSEVRNAAAAPHDSRADPAEHTAQFWMNEAQDALTERLQNENLGTARNVIMFLGDGLSVPTLAAARALLGQREGRPGEESKLAFERWPTVGLAKTYCLDAQIPDSACTATAYLCGVKANYGTLGVTGAVPRWDCDASTDTATHLESIAAWALQDGRDAGIVTTTRVTHASPAGAYANVATRGWENDAQVRAAGHDPARCPDIAEQLINSYPGNQFKVILGGGRREFIPSTTVDEEGTPGRRTDGRDLIQEWQQDKATRGEDYTYVWNRQQLLNASEDGYLLGLFEGSHLLYNLEVAEAGLNQSEPSLADLTEAAIRRLSRNDRGFFLFIEAGRIDHAHHDNIVHLALDETIELSNAVQRAQELTGDDTLLVVTADHAHVMAFNGYTRRGGDILGTSDNVDEHGMPYMTLSYTNGPGFRPHTAEGVRPDFRADSNYQALRWRSTVEVPLDSETHGGDDVAVFAVGPRHHVFTGLYEQSQIPHLMAYAACIGPGRHACSGATSIAVMPMAALAVALISRWL